MMIPVTSSRTAAGTVAGGLSSFWSLELENVADLVDEQADCAVVGTDHDVHGPLVVGSGRQIEAASQIDGRDDLAAQVDQSAHHDGAVGTRVIS